MDNEITPLSNSSDDIQREQYMCWDTRIEDLLHEYLLTCDSKIAQTQSTATCRKWLYLFFGITTIAFPLVLSILQPELSGTLNQTLLVSSGFINGISSFLNPSKWLEIYLASMNKWIELRIDIKLELSKHKRDRSNPTEFIQKVSERMLNYQQSTPFF
jgi:hypothetical protein